MTPNRTLTTALRERFTDARAAPEALEGLTALGVMAGRASCRAFRPEPPAPEIVETLCAVALAAPSKSDLQQRDIVVIRDAAIRARLNALLAGQAWIAGAPTLLVFCANNRRQRQWHEWRGRAFANDHLDAFFNASVDAAIALAAFIAAAEAAGLGCCPISTIRNEAAAVSDCLGLPRHVFPVAGLAVGYPSAAPRRVSMRLPLGATVHVDRFDESGVRAAVDAYDEARRAAERISGGGDERRVWSDQKARQYAQTQREDFGRFVRERGFSLE